MKIQSQNTSEMLKMVHFFFPYLLNKIVFS